MLTRDSIILFRFGTFLLLINKINFTKMVAVSALLLNMIVAVCPKLPFERNFDYEVRPGFQLTVTGQTNEAYHKGLISPDRKGFIINFCEEGIFKGQRVFHVNPRFDKNSTLVLNTRDNYTWGPEERHLNHHMSGAQDFSLVVQAHENEFKIFENGHHFADYKYRKPLNSVTGISLKGLVTVHQVIATQYNLADLPAIANYSPINVTIQHEFPILIENPEIPATIPIPGNVQLGMVLAVVGTPFEHNRFYVRWMTDDDDVAFQLNPQFNENVIVSMNTKFEGDFGMEEYPLSSPFKANSRFYLLVKVHHTHYEVWVNGEHLHDYKHRQIAFEDVTKIIISEYESVQIDNITLTY